MFLYFTEFNQAEVFIKLKSNTSTTLAIKSVTLTLGTRHFKHKADLFNSYFATQCRPLEIESVIPPVLCRTPNSLSNITLSQEKILEVIVKLNIKKAHGIDGISTAMLKSCASEVSKPLYLIYKKCLECGNFPSSWNQCIKKKSPGENELSPDSLLPICGKIFEKIIFYSIYKFLSDNNLLSKNQSDFRPGDSTVNQLLSITT